MQNDIFEPEFFDLNNPADRERLDKLKRNNAHLRVFDEIESQLHELMKIRNPDRKFSTEDYRTLTGNHLSGTPAEQYGLWVYYPWSGALVHLLGKDEFLEVRTNRNRNKVTAEEQHILRTKKVGIAGLSVGQSIALTMVMERICGEIRIADFDTAELSNLNRIRTGVHNLGVRKVIIAAREIKEIDPYMVVRIFPDGLIADTMEEFFGTDDDQLDLFVEVCDSIQVKIDARQRSRSLHIPVVMDTNDRGMIDIERFDLEPEREIFHGKLTAFYEQGDTIIVTDINRQDVVMSILDYDLLSARMKSSLTEIGKTISTWPQLASSVVLGGAATTDISRRILLGQHQLSGRFYIDFEELIS
ncbi:MAG: ThiF family adenylyltransferase [Mucilaginibacter polytrichastri]|nr:ThiF family adenylyltransferase [Mucilaginibacter polytrichastri]